MDVSAQRDDVGQTTSGRGLRLAFVCLGLFMVYLDTTIVNVALPQMQRDLDVGVSGLQWVFDSYVLTFACFLLTSGRLGDVLGRHRVFVVGLAGFTVASAACALSENITALLVSRFVQGAFGSVMITTSLALVHSMYSTPKERARGVSIWAGVGGLALAAGPVLGGLLVENGDWPSIFWLNIPIGVVSIAALLLLGPARESTRRQHLDLVGQVLFAVAVAALTYGMIEASTAGWTAARVLASFAAAVVAAVLFLWREATCAQPMLPLTFFRNRVVVFACAVNFLVFYGLFGSMFLLTLYLQTINGLSAVDTGVRFLALSATIAVGALIAPRLAHLAGNAYPWVSAAGAVLAGFGLLALLRLEVGSGFGTYWWALVLLGLGVAFAMAPATIAVLASVSPERVGVAAGVSQTFRQLGGVLGVAMSGTLALRHVKDGVPEALAGLPVPPQAQQELVDAIGSGRLAAASELPAPLQAAVTSKVGPLLVEGMAVAYTVGAVVALVGLVTPFVLIGRDKTTGLKA